MKCPHQQKPVQKVALSHYQHQRVRLFGSNKQSHVKLSSLHFTNVTEVFVKESYEKKSAVYGIVVVFEKSQPAWILSAFQTVLRKSF